MIKEPRLLDCLRDRIRLKHYSIRTEKAYLDWNRRFILFHNKKHPRIVGTQEVEQFLTYLAVNGRVASSTQNQALSAILFMYKEVLKIEFGYSNYFVFAYFSLIVLFIQVYINKSLKKRPQVFIWTFLGALGLKMFLSLLLLVIVMYAGVHDSKAWAINFISLYFAFSMFSVLQILKAQKRSVENRNEGDKINRE